MLMTIPTKPVRDLGPVPKRITKSRDPILAELREAHGTALMVAVNAGLEEWDACEAEVIRTRNAVYDRLAMFRPKRVRKADRKATEFRRIVAYVAAQPAGFRNHVPSTAMSIENTRHAAHYRAELIEWWLFTQRNVGMRKEFVAAHKAAMQWAAFHRLIAAECGRRLP